jgi:hypothetical protein
MRATVAKKLRRLAREQTVGQPNAVWLDAGRKVGKKKGDKTVFVWAARAELATGCTRAVYQKMKRLYREARHG